MRARTAKRPANNAIRSFYNEALTEAERAEFASALEVDGIDQEIAVLRLRLRTAIREKQAHGKRDAFALMVQGIDLLAKALAAKYRLGPGSEAQLAQSLRRVLDQMKELEGGEADGC